MNGKSGMIESLETRRLLSTVTLGSHGLLKVRGDAGAMNVITVTNDTDPTMIDVSVTGTKANGTPTAPLSQTFTKANVLAVLIIGGAKADTISVGQTNGAFAIPTAIFSGPGNDTVTTGAESDTITASGGNDTVNSGEGNDIVRGGQGDDSITVDGGNDKVHGGSGNDVITAGNGNDTITGGPGNDSVTAGNGSDLLFGGTGNDTVTAGNGNDTMWGGAGDDVITAGNGVDSFGGILGHNTLMGGTGHDTFIVHKLANNVTSYDPAKDTLQLVGHEPGDPNI